MNAHEAKKTIESMLHENEQSLSELTVDQGIEVMLACYRDHRASDCSPETDSDMLQFRFGVYDWGDGESFEFDLTRQFIIDASNTDTDTDTDTDDDDDDDTDDHAAGDAAAENIFQLSLTLKFTPNDKLRALGWEKKWCSAARVKAINYFERYIQGSRAYKTVTKLSPTEIDLKYECVDQQAS